MNRPPFAGSVVVVTGASAGVGRAVAHAFARRGASVALLARGRQGLEDAAREVESLGGTALVVQADVAEAAQVDRAAESVVQRFGRIDVWVNDAMATILAPVDEIPADDFTTDDEIDLAASAESGSSGISTVAYVP